MTVLRPDGEATVNIPLEPAPNEPAPATVRINGQNPLSGMTIANMSPALGVELKLDRIRPGVTVLKISRGSPAARLRFRPMDRLVSINGKNIVSVDDVRTLELAESDQWEIVVDRGGKRLSLVVGQ